VIYKEARRLAYLALAKQQWEDMEAQKADSQRETNPTRESRSNSDTQRRIVLLSLDVRWNIPQHYIRINTLCCANIVVTLPVVWKWIIMS
jgi:hypothetical protein